MDIMDVSKGFHVCVKSMDGFDTLIGKPTRTLVPARCKGAGPILHGLFEVR